MGGKVANFVHKASHKIFAMLPVLLRFSVGPCPCTCAKCRTDGHCERGICTYRSSQPIGFDQKSGVSELFFHRHIRHLGLLLFPPLGTQAKLSFYIFEAKRGEGECFLFVLSAELCVAAVGADATDAQGKTVWAIVATGTRKAAGMVLNNV